MTHFATEFVHENFEMLLHDPYPAYFPAVRADIHAAAQHSEEKNEEKNKASHKDDERRAKYTQNHKKGMLRISYLLLSEARLAALIEDKSAPKSVSTESTFSSLTPRMAAQTFTMAASKAVVFSAATLVSARRLSVIAQGVT